MRFLLVETRPRPRLLPSNSCGRTEVKIILNYLARWILLSKSELTTWQESRVLSRKILQMTSDRASRPGRHFARMSTKLFDMYDFPDLVANLGTPSDFPEPMRRSADIEDLIHG
jgi:hypothetical protein